MMQAAPVRLDEKKNTISSHLVDRLREAILAGTIAPGSKINLERVRENYAVSLSPLREALARLIADGLVEFEDNRGYRVTPLSLENLVEITQLRTEFESLALRNAMAVGDAAWEGEVMRALHRLNRISRDPDVPASLEEWEAAHTNLHLTLVSGCKMPLLVRTCRMLHNMNDRYRRIFLQSRSGDRNVVGEHSEIAQAAVARDVDYACERLREHIQRTGANLRDHLLNAPAN